MNNILAIAKKFQNNWMKDSENNSFFCIMYLLQK